MVPLEGVPKAEMQQWLDFFESVAFEGTTHGPYFE